MSKPPEIYTRIFGKPALRKEKIYARNYVELLQRFRTGHSAALKAATAALQDAQAERAKEVDQ